jgi:hypothetical protein
MPHYLLRNTFRILLPQICAIGKAEVKVGGHSQNVAKLKVPSKFYAPSLLQYTITLVTLNELIKVTSKCFRNIPLTPSLSLKEKKNP